MSSTDQQHPSSNHRLSFSVDTASAGSPGSQHEDEIRRLDELIVDVERLKGEKLDLLRQNVTCKTDIKKLKQR